MTAPTVIRVEGVSKRFVIRKEKSLKERIVNFGRSNLHKEDFWALRDVSLDITSGTTVGLIGPNGSGKSTLLKTVGGILQPTEGQVLLRGRLAALLELGAGFHPDLTGRENVYLNASILGLSRVEIDRHFDAIVDFSGIEQFIDTQVKFYSSGMYVRLAFAVAVHVDPDILLVDEVLAVGDEPFQRKCLERIRNFQAEGRTIVLVTHSLDQVADFCDRAVVLESGAVVADGTPREALTALRKDFEAERQQQLARARAAEHGTTRPDAEFIGVSAHRPDGTYDVPLRQGDGMRIRMTTRAAVPVHDPEIEVSLTTPVGTTVYRASTRTLGVTVPTLTGEQQFEVALGALPLNAGDYVVRTELRSSDGSELHTLPIAAKFTVEGEYLSPAPLYATTSFEVL
ncbi:ABC transporter ATP-binding protein [Cellulomonas telluris]|uniref:ABC transporter ATP-binding protein n=1 Tax=Cellulomonas telluris TaxID=2306636 RepID=UPI0010A75716|nr:ABC transporter ATP-binding protein [Cellulomonas telluris]